MGCGRSVLAVQDSSGYNLQKEQSEHFLPILTSQRLSSAFSSRSLTGNWKSKRLLVPKGTNEFDWAGEWRIPTSLLGQANDECLLAVASHLKPRVLGKDEILFGESDEGTSMFFVNKGIVNVLSEPQQITSFNPKSYLGEAGLMLNEARSTTAVAAEDNTQVLELSQNDFFEVVERYPQFGGCIYASLSARAKERLQDKVKNETASGPGSPINNFVRVLANLNASPLPGTGEELRKTASSGSDAGTAAGPPRGAGLLARSFKLARTFSSSGPTFTRAGTLRKLSAEILRAGSWISTDSAEELRLGDGSAAPGAPGSRADSDADERTAAGEGRVTRQSARPGLVVSLDVEGFLAAAGGHWPCRFPGDEGPGQLLEDHFGDGSMWRVRWLRTNSWGIYSTGYEGQYHLFVGSERAKVAFDQEAFLEPGRMPSFFFCAPVPGRAEDRNAMLQYSSPRSRLLMA